MLVINKSHSNLAILLAQGALFSVVGRFFPNLSMANVEKRTREKVYWRARDGSVPARASGESKNEGGFTRALGDL